MSMSGQGLQNTAWKELQLGKLLGQGGFGEVYLGSWQGKEVAVKTLTLKKLRASLAKDFENETRIMAECAQCEQIVKLFAVCMESDHYAMVMEYMQQGSLYDYLRDDKMNLTWPLRYQITIDIGNGLRYLHDREILHRDLKSLNVLINQLHRAKISDFGLSKLKMETSSISKLSTNKSAKETVGTLRWKAPELFKLKPIHTKSSDAYSLGMTMWEIATGQIPFKEADDAIIQTCVKEGEQEDIPADCPPEYSSLIKRSWSLDPEKRPSPHYIVLQLEKLLPPTPKQKQPAPPSVSSSSITPQSKAQVPLSPSQTNERRPTKPLPSTPKPQSTSSSVSSSSITPLSKAQVPLSSSQPKIKATSLTKGQWEQIFSDEGGNTLLAQISDLRSVTELDLSECEKISNKGLEQIARFPALTSLNLQGCDQITDKGLEQITKLTALRSLNLQGCKRISDKGLEQVTKLTSLTSLNLYAYNSDKVLEHIAKLTALTWLNLAYCDLISDKELERVAKLTALTSLNLEGCKQINDKGLEQVAKLTALTSLDLSSCYQISDKGLEQIAKLTSLTLLGLGGCYQISDTGLEQITKLPAITSLNLVCCEQISDKGLEQVAKLTALTSLDLAYCKQINDKRLEQIAKLTALTSLNLKGCKLISDKGLEQVAKLTVLTSLDLTGCKNITSKGIEMISKRLPGCHITKY